jgi:hypothetical protein
VKNSSTKCSKSNPKRIIRLLPLLLLTGCGGSATVSVTLETEEFLQHIGETMAAIDESAGNATSTYGSLIPLKSSPQTSHSNWMSACDPLAYSTCTANVISRVFSGCTVDDVSFNGVIDLNFTDAASDTTCELSAPGHTTTRTPNYTASISGGYTFTVTRTGVYGQRVTRGAGANYSLTSDGIKRVFSSGSDVLFSNISSTSSPMAFTGHSRLGRVLSSGTLQVDNQVTGVICNFSPTLVTWAATCTCATSGTWTGSCSNGKTFVITLGATCGQASLSVNGATATTLVFDRCYGI